MSEWAAKRFWTDTDICEVDQGYSITLDGRVVKTPAKNALVLPSKTLAQSIAQEWDAQEGKIEPLTMPLTKIANSAVDKVLVQQDAVIHMLAEYADSDLICYRATAPAELVAFQAEKWDPVLKWVFEKFGQKFFPVHGVMHQPQPLEAVAEMHNQLSGLTHFQLAGVHDLITISGSLLLAISLTQNHLLPEQAWQLSRVDEQWQEEQWGVDEEASEVTRKKHADFLIAYRFYHEART